MFSALSILTIAVKRLWNHRGLMLCLAVGLLAAVAVAMSIPLYADAVSYNALRNEVFEGRERPPFAFLYRHVGAWSGTVEWEQYKPADDYLTTRAPEVIGLPLLQIVRHVRTARFRLFPVAAGAYSDPRIPLEWVEVGFLSDLESHIHLLDGAFPVETDEEAEALPVLIHEELANTLGLQVGEEYIVFGGREEEAVGRTAQLRVSIAGVWRPKDAREPYWFYQQTAFEKVLLVAESVFAKRIAPQIKDEVYLAVWQLLFDGRALRTEDIEPLISRVNQANMGVASLLSDVELEVSPVDELQEHLRTTLLLSIVLYVFALPVIVLVLYFISLLSGMVVQRQRQEIAMLRSRGASRLQVIGIYAVEAALLGMFALGVGIPLARALAQVMSNTRSFLSFVPRAALPLHFSPASLRVGLGTVALGLAASVFPALRAADYTIVTHKQDVARAMGKPFWQRYFLDVLLLVPPAYGYYLLRQRGTISLLGQEMAYGSDPFQNPLLFLVPTLFLFGTALLCVRLFPVLMKLLAWLGSRSSGASWLLALRHLARSSHYYIGPLVLISVTLGLAAFTASMAETLNRHLAERVYYHIGADMRLVERGRSLTEEESLLTMGSTSPESAPSTAEEGLEESPQSWLFLPVEEHCTVPGVERATRVGVYRAWPLVVGDIVEGLIVGIDRAEFPHVAFFRRDFAEAPLGALMNVLALRNDALLVSESFLADHSLRIGDRIKLRMDTYGGDRKDVLFTVAGTLRYFPGVYPEDGPFFVANLDYIFQEIGGQRPYDVWLKTDGRDPEAIVEGVKELGLLVITAQDARTLIAREESRPEQRGTFGVLSIGFMTAAILTVLGFLVHSVLSFRERFIELGVLRAVGLSVQQMATFLATEQAILIAAGVGVGTGLGIVASRLFIPFLQVRSGPHPQTPPFAVVIAWDSIFKVYAVFGVMLLLAIIVMLSLLLRMKVFQAIKLGDTG